MKMQDAYTYLAWVHRQLEFPDQDNPYWGNIYHRDNKFMVTFAKGGSTSTSRNIPGEWAVDPEWDYGDLTEPQHFHIFMRNPYHRLRSQIDHFTANIRREFGYSVSNVALFTHLPSAVDSHIHPQVGQIPIRKEYIATKKFGKRNWVLNSRELDFMEYMEWTDDTFTFTKWGDGDDVVKLIHDHLGLKDREIVRANESTKYEHFPQGFPAQHQTNTVNTVCEQLCTEDLKLWNWISD